MPNSNFEILRVENAVGSRLGAEYNVLEDTF